MYVNFGDDDGKYDDDDGGGGGGGGGAGGDDGSGGVFVAWCRYSVLREFNPESNPLQRHVTPVP